MRVQVPSSVNVKKLVLDLHLSPTRSENLKNKIYYFLSRIVSTNENFHLNEKTNGYRKISSSIMKNILGYRVYYEVLDLLLNPLDPIIETDVSWHNSKGKDQNGYCKGYRLTQKYNTGEIDFKTLPRKFGERIQKYTKDISQKNVANVDYQFLLDQFESQGFTFIPLGYDYILNFGKILLSQVENNNEYQRTMVLNLIGRWLYDAEKIQEDKLWHSVSKKNHRLHSRLTNLNGKLRPFLLCNGEPLGNADVSASHPYTLSTILSDRFLNGTGEGYNLWTIYPEILEELVGTGMIVDSTYSENCFIYSSTFTGGTSNHVCNNTGGGGEETQISPPPFMWCKFSNQDDRASIHKYRSARFDGDYYKDIILKSQRDPVNIEDITDEQRNAVKESTMLILFQDNQGHRYNEENIMMFRKVYPGVDKWINQIHHSVGRSKFSYLLQRAESYLVLNVVARQFHEKYPTAPIFTIHDAIYTYPEHLPELHRLILESFYSLTGVRVGAKIKSEIPNPEPKQEEVDEEWREIRPVRDRKKFEKVRAGIFTSNVKRGANFLEQPIC